MKLLIAFLAIVSAAATAKAHGEDKPGPHGGHIRMPANFHTEVIANKNGSFHVYLLDLQFQNPVVKNSEVKGYVVSEKKRKYALKCAVMNQDHFRCVAGGNIKSGNLVIHAKRSGTTASMEAKYALPLKEFDTRSNESTPPAMPDHSAH